MLGNKVNQNPTLLCLEAKGSQGGKYVKLNYENNREKIKVAHVDFVR